MLCLLIFSICQVAFTTATLLSTAPNILPLPTRSNFSVSSTNGSFTLFGKPSISRSVPDASETSSHSLNLNTTHSYYSQTQTSTSGVSVTLAIQNATNSASHVATPVTDMLATSTTFNATSSTFLKNAFSTQLHSQVTRVPAGSTFLNSSLANTVQNISSPNITAQETNASTISATFNGRFSTVSKNISSTQLQPQATGISLSSTISNNSLVSTTQNSTKSHALLSETTEDLLTCPTSTKAVFAHFMVSNVGAWSQGDWEDDIGVAQTAHIDAFALNIAYNAVGDTNQSESILKAFDAADSKGFKLFFSFDYAGGSPWLESAVITMIKTYSSRDSYYQYLGKPFVSTFEGPNNSDDWTTIKAETGCFFIPSWSSLGAKEAVAKGEADGLLSWAGWPWGNLDMDTHVDASYLQYLSESGTAMPYMMPVSPWFYTNLEGFDKNWLWRGDDLWYDRWQEVMFVQPDFVEILTWNDYGESHYIGPLDDRGYSLFDYGEATYNFASGMPHDGWRLFLPYVIDTYKTGIASITQEGLVAWYRLNPATDSACSTGYTSGNTHTQRQLEFEPADVVQDKIFYSALLGSEATVTVTVDGEDLGATWTDVPYDGVGIYHGSVSFSGKTGTVVISIPGATVTGPDITTTCTDGIQNFNAWVGYATGSSTSATPSLAMCNQVCIAGKGVNNFSELCEFSCRYGYCPIGACTCTAMGPQAVLPDATGVMGYPLSGESASYSGLCSFVCNYGPCPDSSCGTVDVGTVESTTSPFDPLTCTAGTGEGNLAGLCSFACNYGFCPINSCTCTATGTLVLPTGYTGAAGYPIPGLDKILYGDLCNFACAYGHCPDDACYIPSDGSGVEYIDPIIFLQPSPTIWGLPSATLVIPPSTMNSETLINFPPVTTSLVVGTSTFSILTPSPYATSVISFFNIPVPSGVTYSTFALTSSFEPPPLMITVGIITTTVFFLPVTTPANVITTTSSLVYSLRTTVYTSNGVTQTFSEDQFTDLRTITAPTTIITSLVKTSTTSGIVTSTTTVVPVWVQIGGFYWSPVPLPTPTSDPIPIPVLPGFPPIPDPPCFDLFDIFSIDCPPDKTKPTTTFMSGYPSPTCTSNCGTLCTVNCLMTGTASSEECTTETVTNYWATCSDETCSTTRSQTITGCYVTATTTTTGDYCPATGAAVSSDDDQGQDGTSTGTLVYTTVSLGESVYVSGTAYAVTSDTIVYESTTLAIPDVTAPTTETIGGYGLTIYPGGIYVSGVSIATPISTSVTATTTSSAPTATATDSFNIYLWECDGTSSGIFDWYGAASTSADWCSSNGALISETEDNPPATGETFTVCGFKITITAIDSDGSLEITDPNGIPTLCAPLTGSGMRTCTWSDATCTVLKKYTCDLLVC